jgi:hypothetical protein
VSCQNVNALTSFSLQVFGRWDGKQNGIDMDLGVYVFIATYSINNQIAKSKKGTLMIVR